MQWRNPSPSLDHDACGTGFVFRLAAPPSRGVVDRALVALQRLAHRGAVDAAGNSGDGAGLMTSVPEEFFRRCAQEAGIKLPSRFAVGMMFLPEQREAEVRRIVETCAQSAGLPVLGWRTVPTNPAVLGERALQTLPQVRQVFLDATDVSPNDLELSLFLLRKRAEALAPRGIYFCSLSARTVVYKGLLSPNQLADFYLDLMDPEFRTSFAIFHQRFSTNTRPTWSLAQPFRFIAHNGEINTISGNRRWMRAREASVREAFGVEAWFRSLEPDVSDSANFDNAFETLLRQGFSPAAAMLRMVPPAWEGHPNVPTSTRIALARQAWQSEPWDGPAALVFSDGVYVGAKLDRNGLRPLRVVLSNDGWLIAGSEAGLADFGEATILKRSRLGPGEMLLAEIASGKLWRDYKVLDLLPKQDVAEPDIQWVEPQTNTSRLPRKTCMRKTRALGWTEDQVRILFQPLATQGKEATWSMGDDAPPAYLSQMRRSLWDYCRQRFAQVTNPPIDPIREAHVMSLDTYLGPALALSTPIIDHAQVQTLRTQLSPVCTLDMTFSASRGVAGALAALRSVEARAASSQGMILLSDRRVSRERAALPALLAAAAAAKGTLRAGRHATPLIVETGQVFDAHHVALLIAVGAAAVHPWLAMDLAEQTVAGGGTAFRSAVVQGLRKVLARMGISTLVSYRNSHLFEVLGLDPEVHQEFFEDATFVLPGKSLAELLDEALARHASSFAAGTAELPDAGYYRFRKNGELHANSPDLVRKFQSHLKSMHRHGSAAGVSPESGREPVTIRDLLDFVSASPIVLDAVEPAGAILQRISTQAMSLGAISPEAHRTLALAMNRLGARSNTGEGGEDPEIYQREPEANNKVKQVASGRFGVTTEYLVQAEEIEIKMAQGSKPGEGGQLPAFKVSPYIARLRHVVPGTSLISPPPHHDIYSIEDLAQLIHDLRAVNPLARIGVKLVSGAGVGIIAVGVAKAGANVITISGHDGGTGASPLTSIKNAGLPWEVGLREAHCELTQAGLRSRVRLRVDGGLKFGRDVVIAALLGADEFGFGTAALLAIGCVMARQCHLNTCPVGIATQDETLRMRFTGKPEMVINYFLGVAAEVRQHLASLGVGTLQEIVGRVDLLRPRECTRGSSVSALLDPLPPAPERTAPAEIPRTPHGGLDETLILRRRSAALRLTNSDRSVGAQLSGELLRQRWSLPRNGQRLYFSGVAGQSFAAFLTSGLTFHLCGEANDYVGKGLSGGRVVISLGPAASLRGDVLVGNTVLYGATDGELYVAGRAGERFAVRNSGALAVVEGTGDHACEYMTAGIVLNLGKTGINFGSGMTGGLAYAVRDHLRPGTCNSDFVVSAGIEQDEANWIARVLQRHLRLTGSPIAYRLLQEPLPQVFARVQPIHLPSTVSQTWAPVRARLRPQIKPQRRSGEGTPYLPFVPPLPAKDFPQSDEPRGGPGKVDSPQISL
ncbi:MAG: glutamate synthase large subunit [Acidobacteriia bacterium]|nr:glutamate synthase large subunit [Terriglobia bacterium]